MGFDLLQILGDRVHHDDSDVRDVFREHNSAPDIGLVREKGDLFGPHGSHDGGRIRLRRGAESVRFCGGKIHLRDRVGR